MTVRINLLPEQRRPAKKQKRGFSRPSLPKGGPTVPISMGMFVGLAALVIVLVAVFLYFGERRAVAETRAAIDEAQADSVRLHDQVVRVRAMESAQEELAARVRMMENVVQGRLYWIRFMETLSRTLPEHTWMVEIDREDLGPDQVRIAGATFSNAAVTQLMRGLEASSLLQDITLIGVTRTQQDSLQYQSFTLVADFEEYDAVVIEPRETPQEGGQ